MSLPIGRVAELAHVTVRTLHHYDEIGLLRPSGRTTAGYRRYSDADLDRLQQILFYRELGFALPDIKALLDDPDASPTEHLRRQRALLGGRIARLQEMAAAVEKALEARAMGINLTPEEKFELFGPEYEGYEAEAEQRWGETEAWRRSREKAARYTKEDWVRIKADADDLDRRIGEAVRAGAAADGAAAMDLAEEHRRHIGRWFYDCSYRMHRGMADMYMSDPRFTEYYDRVAPGAAAWFRTAIHANADRGAADTAAQ